MPDYNLLGSTEVLEELQQGRTRELLLLLQDKPVPEVVDPLNLQEGLSDSQYEIVNGDYKIFNPKNKVINNFNDGTVDPLLEDWSWGGTTDVQVSGSEGYVNSDGGVKSGTVSKSGSSVSPDESSFTTRSGSQSSNTSDYFRFEYRLSGVDFLTIRFNDSGNVTANGTQILSSWSQDTNYDCLVEWDWGNSATVTISGNSVQVSISESGFDAWGILNDTGASGGTRFLYFDDLKYSYIGYNSTKLTDQFSAPTTAPADFKSWNAIQARDVATGGSTSANPVEFEILDSSDSVLNSSRIPKARIADEPFVMRNRVYSVDAVSDGQTDYTIATTGDGGHFGIPILTVVSVKKNGSVIDSANWSFDGDTVTIDTSNVSIVSGDTIEIKYDFDVFDSTLQPRAYLNRESTSETSPSISHFRYEYVI